MTEAQFQQAVEQLALMLGVFTWHDTDSRRNKAGFLDLVCIGANGVLFRELKVGKGRLRKEQVYVLEALRAAGADADVWRDIEDWPNRVKAELQALGKVTVPRPAA